MPTRPPRNRSSRGSRRATGSLRTGMRGNRGGTSRLNTDRSNPPRRRNPGNIPRVGTSSKKSSRVRKPKRGRRVRK